eukprot:TRINITY_DN22026_c0_g1_i3.p1 TRINITY_DN22026_c0_g1~~TRINITY_DN22026_c0_g1_i3.p1  ORF type:complete len:166 (-),score=5.79 TRINITY_DN22026_c0_g1_i3:31-528(-)
MIFLTAVRWIPPTRNAIFLPSAATSRQTKSCPGKSTYFGKSPTAICSHTDELVASLAAYSACETFSGQDGLETFTLVECRPVTGRTHQIRAHMAYLGHPLVADANYNPRGQARRHFEWCRRLWLHCSSTSVDDLRGQRLAFHEDIPHDLREALASKVTNTVVATN